MSHTYNWIGNNPRFTFEGKIDFDELKIAHNELYGNSKFDLVEFCIINLLKADFKISQNQILMLTELDKGASRWNENLILVIIIDENNDNLKQVAAQYMALMKDSKWEIILCNTLKEAVEWCNQCKIIL